MNFVLYELLGGARLKCLYQCFCMDLHSKLGDSEGKGSLSCYSPRGHKEADMT